MQSIGENCYRVLPVIIDDDDGSWELILATLDRWGDRAVPRDSNWPK